VASHQAQANATRRIRKARQPSETAPLRSGEFLVFEVGGQRCGIPSSEVAKVLRAVTLVPLKAPAIIEGVFNLRAQ
jgi:chemotaxis signal transduction protein